MVFENIIKIQDKKILVDSGMDENAFGKTNYALKVGLKSYTAISTYTNDSFDFDFFTWQFSSTKLLNSTISNNDHVFFEGNIPNGEYNSIQSLSELLISASKTNKKNILSQYAVAAVCTAITQAFSKNIPIVIPGAGGIIIAENIQEKKFTIIFLPCEIFTAAASYFNNSIYAAAQGFWARKGLSIEETNAFIRASIAYTGITGELPYTETDSDKRQVDMLDRNFTPVEYMINGIENELAESIDKGLSLGPVNDKQNTKKLSVQKEFPLEMLYQELGLQTDMTIKQFEHKTSISDKEFLERKKKREKKQQGKIARNRKIRRNTTFIITVSIIAVIVIIIGINTYNTKLEKPTSQGLTSKETITAFYEGIHKLNMDTIQYLAKGKAAHRYTDSVSTIYVTDKSRNTYEHLGGPFTPEIGIYYLRNTNPMLYGLTHFKINGEEHSLNLTIPSRKTAKIPIKEEYGKKIQDGQIKIYTVSFYLVYTEGKDNTIYVAFNQDLVEVTFKSNKWVITNITTKKYKELSFDSVAFKKDFKEKSANIKDYKKSMAVAQDLRSKYQWLPDNTALTNGLKEIQKENKDFLEMTKISQPDKSLQSSAQ